MCSTVEYRGAALAGLLLILGIMITACGATPPIDRQLVVRGNLLFDGSKRWIASGANDYVLPFYDDGPGKPDADLAAFTTADFKNRAQIFHAMRRDGINVVRVPVGLSGFRGRLYGLSRQSYVHRLQLVATAARRAGLRVLVCWFDSAGMGSALPRDYRQDFPFMRSVVQALRRDPWVFYEPDNEPNGIATAAWRRVMSATVREWRGVLGYRGPLVLDTPGYSWTFPRRAVSSLQHLDASLLGGPSQLVFANHRYPDGAACFCGATKKAWLTTVGRWVSRYPILGTEYGAYVKGFPPNDRWLAEMVSYLRRRAVPKGDNGMIAFVWSWVDPSSLTRPNHVTLNASGRVVRRGYWSDPRTRADGK